MIFQITFVTVMTPVLFEVVEKQDLQKFIDTLEKKEDEPMEDEPPAAASGDAPAPMDTSG